ncbi:MAG: peptidase [Pirellulales bacterium]|nr:peptidase [Pirellulales bacterium]
MGICLPGAVASPAADDPPERFSHGVLIRFEGPITPMLQQYLFRKLDAAERDRADLVIVEIDSPGGFVDASIAIAERLRDTRWAHTVAYVPREAISGAAIAALGCDEIVMAPDARIGDAGPIYQGEDSQFRHAPEKIRDYLAQTVRDLAEAKGRPPAIAEAMVDRDAVVYRVKDRRTGRETLLSEREIQADADPDRWEKVKMVPESEKGKFLTVNGKSALALGLADATASGRDALRVRYRLSGELRIVEPSGVDTAVYLLNLPIVTGLLFVIGLVALYVEFSAPGIGLGGLTAVLCFALFFWSRFLGGTADWLEVILFLSGLLFLAVELFVLPGFGVAGLTGLLLLLTSLILAGQTFVIPRTEQQWSVLTDTLLVIFASGGVFLVAAVVLTKYLGEIPVLGMLQLRPPDPSETGRGAGAPMGQQAGLEPGDRGVADSPLRPAGKVRFGQQFVDVVTEGLLVDKGATVEVVKISGNRVVVREVLPKEEGGSAK